MSRRVGTNDRGSLLHYSCGAASEDEGAEEKKPRRVEGGAVQPLAGVDRRSSKLFSVGSKVISHSGVKLDLKTERLFTKQDANSVIVCVREE